MIKIDNLELRNLEEQVLKNKDDITYIMNEQGVLNQFGIKVVGQVAYLQELPSVSDYKLDNENWEYGDTYAVGLSAPYSLYVLTRANQENVQDYWFNIGQFPAIGPKGEPGEAADITVDSTVTTPPGSLARVENIGDKNHSKLVFYIPSGEKGEKGDSAQAITITSSASATSGTLTEEQLTTLQASDQNYIIFNNEIYRLEDKQSDSGFLIYSHTGQDSTKTMFIKEISINISTRGWVLSKLQPQAYNANTIIGTTAGESSNYVINTNSFRIESGVPVWEAARSHTQTVTFPTPFTSAPTVTITAFGVDKTHTSNVCGLAWVTAEGFQFSVYGHGNNDKSIGAHWIAIGK